MVDMVGVTYCSGQLWGVSFGCWYKGALTEAGGTFEDRAVERRHLAGSMSVRQEKLVLCVLEWQETETGRSRERHFGPNETGA